MKKVKMKESKRSLPPVKIRPEVFLDLYLAGINNFSFVSKAQSQMAQKPSGTKEEITINGVELSLQKRGSTIHIERVSPHVAVKDTAIALIGSLGKVLSKGKRAIDISTAA